MQWSGKEEFVASPKVPFLVDGSEAGLLKRHGPLSFLKIPLSLSHTHFHEHMLVCFHGIC